jgi:hypothetical protein
MSSVKEFMKDGIKLIDEVCLRIVLLSLFIKFPNDNLFLISTRTFAFTVAHFMA